MTPEKKPCPLSVIEFVRRAEPIVLDLDGRKYQMMPKEFASGSFGWYCQAKLDIVVAGVAVPCQFNFCLTAIGSKPTTPTR